MNVWIKLHNCVVSNLRTFGRIWLACKKKYKVMLMKDKNNKRSHEISEHDRKEC